MASVDLTLTPHATGAAADFAGSHVAEHPLKLYGGWFCPFVQRTWITLHEKNIPHQYIETNPYKKSPEFMTLNPRGLVPTLAVPLLDEGQQKPLYESAVICEYLDEVYTGDERHGLSLLPVTPYERARCKIWIDHIAHKIVPGFYKFMQHTPEKAYTIEEARSAFLRDIKLLVTEMEDGINSGPWFLGDRFSMVDVMLAPWAKRLFLFDRYKPGGLGFPVESGDSEEQRILARWQRWYGAILGRKSVLETSSEDQAYVSAYKRYAEDTTQSLVAQATRKGERLP